MTVRDSGQVELKRTVLRGNVVLAPRLGPAKPLGARLVQGRLAVALFPRSSSDLRESDPDLRYHAGGMVAAGLSLHRALNSRPSPKNHT